jgi:hypothetical protein
VGCIVMNWNKRGREDIEKERKGGEGGVEWK